MSFVCRICGHDKYSNHHDIYFCRSCTTLFIEPGSFSLPMVKVKKLDIDNAVIPKRSKDGDVGYDICSIEEQWIPAGEIKLIKTGISIELPPNTEAQIRSRSGMGKKGIMVANQPGTIDTGYRGMCGVLLYNSRNSGYRVKKGDKVAQMLITTKLPYRLKEVQEELSETERGSAGFNSTGR